MTRPDYVYRFTRHRTDGQGTRFDLTGWHGPGCYAPLVCPLKRTGEPVLYVNRWRVKEGAAPDPRKGGLILAAPGKAKGEKGRNVSSIFEPSPDHPGRGYGDIGPRKDAILTIRDEEAGTLTVLVFLKLGQQAETLFLSWLDGGVAEEVAAPALLTFETLKPSDFQCLDNNVQFASNIDTEPEI